MRLIDGCRVIVRAGASADEREGAREKFVVNGMPPADVTVPLITAPLLARNDTEAVAIWTLVAVTTWTPAVGASVHVTVAMPALSVVLVGADTDPPPVTVQVTDTPATERLAPSSAWTTSGSASDVETSPD
jgi:hypothetical protein